MAQLRSPNGYQTQIVAEAKQSLGSNRNVLIEAPTGAGKSGLVSLLADHWVGQAPQNRALILEDSLAIFQQMAGFTPTGAKAISEVEEWIGTRPGSIGDVTYGGDQQNGARIVVGMVDTIQSWLKDKRREDLQKYNLVLIDEAHHTYNHKDSQYRQVLEYLEAQLGKKVLVVGASATPWRPEDAKKHSGYDQLDPAFLTNCDHRKIQFMEVHKEGRVVMPKTFTPDVRNERGDSAETVYRDLRDLPRDHAAAIKEVSERLAGIRTPTWWENAVTESLKIAGGDSVLWFSEDVREEGADLTKAMDALGVKHAFIHAGTARKEKERLIAEFSGGELKHLVSCGTLIEGFNASIAKVAVNARKCTTKRFQQQIVGRVVRKHGNYEIGKVIDLGATSWLYGAIEARYRHEAAVEARNVSAEAIFVEMAQIGNGWALQSDGVTNWYARMKGNSVEFVEARVKDQNRKAEARFAPLTLISGEAFALKMRAVNAEYALGAAAAPASSRGRAAGCQSAWEEHLRERAFTGAELDQLFAPQAKASAKVLPMRRRPAFAAGGLKAIMEELHPRAVKMAEVLGNQQAGRADALKAGASVLEAFVAISDHLPRGKCKQARVDIQVAQRALDAEPMTFKDLQAGMMAASKTLGSDDLRATASEASCGATRRKAHETIDGAMQAIHLGAVMEQRAIAAAPAPRAAGR